MDNLGKTLVNICLSTWIGTGTVVFLLLLNVVAANGY